MSHQEKRKILLRKLIKTLEELKKDNMELDEEKLINLLGFEEGISRRTAKEYLTNAKGIIENGTD